MMCFPFILSHSDFTYIILRKQIEIEFWFINQSGNGVPQSSSWGPIFLSRYIVAPGDIICERRMCFPCRADDTLVYPSRTG